MLRAPTARSSTRPTRRRCTGCWPPTRSRRASWPAGSRPPAPPRPRSARRCGASVRRRELDAVCLAGANLIPFAVPGAERAAAAAFAERARRAGRRCSTIVGPRGLGRPALGPAGPALGPGPRPPAPPAAMAIDGLRRSRPSRGCGRSARPSWRRCCRPRSRCSPRRSASARSRVDGGAGYRARVAELVAGRALAGLDRGRRGALQGRDRRRLPRRLPGAGRLGRPRLPRPGHRRRRAPRPWSSTRAPPSPRWSACTSTTSTPPPAPPTAGSDSVRSASTPACCSGAAAVRLTICAVRTRRGPAFLTLRLIAVPLLGRLLRQRGGRREGRRRGLPRRLVRRPSRRRREGHHRRRRRHRPAGADREGPPGRVTVGEARKGRRPGGKATVAWTATWDLAAAPDWTYDASLDLRKGDNGWQVVAEPTLVHPDLGRGSTSCSPAACADRAPITDAAGTPLFAPTEVVNVGVDPAQVTDLPALAAALSAATGVAADRIVADVQKATPGQFVPVITLRRPDFEKIRAQVFDLPGAVFPTSTRLLAPSPASPSRCSDGSARRPPRSSRRARTASPRYAEGDQLGLSGLQRAFQEQLAGTRASPYGRQHRQEHRPTRDARSTSWPRCRASRCRRRSSRPCRTAADAAVAGQALPTHLVVVRPGHGRDPRRLLERGGRRRQRAGRPLPAGIEHEDDDGDRAALRRYGHPDTPVPCPGTTVVDGREFENEDKFDLGTVPLRDAFAAVLQHDFHPAGPRRCPTVRWPRPRRPTASAPTGSCRSASTAAPSRPPAPAPRRRPTRSARARC